MVNFFKNWFARNRGHSEQKERATLMKYFLQGKYVFFLIMFILFGCATHRSNDKVISLEKNFVEALRIGVGVKNFEGEVKVHILIPGGAGASAGLREGDIVRSVDNKKISSNSQLRELLSSKRKGEHVVISVNRDGQDLQFDIEPKPVKFEPMALNIRYLLDKGEKVVVAVVVSDVKISTVNNLDERFSGWLDSTRYSVQSSIEDNLLLLFSDEKNFMLVNTPRLNNIRNEMKFNPGLTPDRLRTEIGQMTGAKYLIDANFSRFPNGKRILEEKNCRLIEIETGSVLAADYEKQYNLRLMNINMTKNLYRRSLSKVSP
jgi:membrane-associated protease RseP (regulator of RpoE activity)